MPKITMYSKTPCKPCSELKLWFKLKHIDYEEVNINDHIGKLSDLGFMAAPVVQIDDTHIAGSNISDVRKAIESHGGMIDAGALSYA